MAYVKRHPTNNLKTSINYIKNKDKTDELLTYEHNLPSSDTNEIVDMMNLTKEKYKKIDGIQGHHFIQSFKHDEDITLVQAHQVGKEWSEKFLNDYEFVLATHKDKNHIHNHIIINSVNIKNGQKYLKNDKELNQIRILSDEVCQAHNLSIIKPLEKNKLIVGNNKSYGEWKMQQENISWKDKIKIDIDETILKSDSYEEFIEQMQEKDYELRYGEEYKYNSFEHFDIGKRIRGRTLGNGYTEKEIKTRILNKEHEEQEQRIFNEAKYFVNGISNKEIVSADIDLSILEVTTYEEFINTMQEKNYQLRYGENYKHNSFKHSEMKRAVRGQTIGYEYTETKIKERVATNKLLQENRSKKETIEIQKQEIFSKRYVNNKFKYLKSSRSTIQMSTIQKQKIAERRKAMQINRVAEFLDTHEIIDVTQYLDFKESIHSEYVEVITELKSLIDQQKEIITLYKEQPTEEKRTYLKQLTEVINEENGKREELNLIQSEFKYVDRYLKNQLEERQVEDKKKTREEEKKEKGKDYGDFIR